MYCPIAAPAVAAGVVVVLEDKVELPKVEVVRDVRVEAGLVVPKVEVLVVLVDRPEDNVEVRRSVEVALDVPVVALEAERARVELAALKPRTRNCLNRTN